MSDGILSAAPEGADERQAPTPEQGLASGTLGLWLLALSLLGLLVVGSVLGELSNLVKDMHLSGRPGTAIEPGLSGQFDDVVAQIASWKDYVDPISNAPGAGHPSAWGITLWFLAIDTALFVPLYAAALLLFVRRPSIALGLGEIIGEGEASAASRSGEESVVQRRIDGATTSYRRVLAAVPRLVCLLVVVDLIENALSVAVLLGAWPEETRGSGWLPWAVTVLGGATITKWLLVVLVLIPVLIVVVRFVGANARRAYPVIRLVRAQLVLAVLLAVLMLLRLQASDVLLGLGWMDGLVLLLLLLLYAAVTWAVARNLVQLETEEESPALVRVPYPRLYLLLGALALVAVAVVVHVTGGEWMGPVVPIFIGAAVIFLGRPAKSFLRRAIPPGETPVVGAEVLPRLLGASALAAVGIGVVRAATGDFFYSYVADQGWDWFWYRVPRLLFGVMLVGSAAVVYELLRRVGESFDVRQARGTGARDRPSNVAIVIGAALVAVLVSATVWTTARNQFGFARSLTPVGVIIVGTLAASLLTGLLVWRVERAWRKHGVPPAFRLLGFRRLPILLLLVVWAFIAAGIRDSYFDVRLRSRAAMVVPPPRSLNDALDRWITARLVDTPAGGDRRTGIPLVVVAAEGGGIRAAYWTSLVLDCALEARPDHTSPCTTADRWNDASSSSPSVFLASGVSGGSVGLAEFAALRYQHPKPQPADAGWVRDRVGGDQLSAQLAWQVLVELPRSFLKFSGPDRAEILERTWEMAWGPEGASNPMNAGLVSSQGADIGADVPLLLLNGASALDGCGLATWMLDEGVNHDVNAGDTTLVGDCLSLTELGEGEAPHGALPGFTDLDDFLCDDKDLRLSTAALLSARFPYVSPAGRLSACGDNRVGEKYVVDGGYIETSGAEPVMGLWPSLDRVITRWNAGPQAATHCVVPFFVQIDNGYSEQVQPEDESQPNQLLVPPEANRTAGRGQRGNRARQVAAAEFNRPYGDGLDVVDGALSVTSRWMRIATRPHPGAQAPLGWSLSPSATGDLEDQLTRNSEEIGRLRGWLDGGLTCAGQSGNGGVDG